MCCSRMCFVLKSPARCLFCSHCSLKLSPTLWTNMVPDHWITWHQREPVKAHQLSRVLFSAVLSLGRYCAFLLPVFPRILLMSILETWLSLAFVLGEKNIMTSGQKKQKGQLVKVTHQKQIVVGYVLQGSFGVVTDLWKAILVTSVTRRVAFFHFFCTYFYKYEQINK